MTSPKTRLPRVLLVEPQFVLRRTICSVGAELSLANVTEALNIESAHEKLKVSHFDALILGGIETPALAQLVTRIRSGQAGCRADLHIVATMSPSASVTSEALEQVGVDAVITRPFKVGQIFSVALKPPRKPVPVGSREFQPTESLHEEIKIQ